MDVGMRVVRGPNWKWASQDGGPGHVGCVVVVGRSDSDSTPSKTVVVLWDSGFRSNYRVGYQGAYDLRVFDSAATGVKHPQVACRSCRTPAITGHRWKCSKCRDYDLCPNCYHADKHSTRHTFLRCDAPGQPWVKVPKRFEAEKMEFQGIFPSALVVRGSDWDWGNQDGGAGQEGRVVKIRDWEMESSRSVANVRWSSGATNVYRVGHKGKVDLKASRAAPGGSFYPQHLPVLGDFEQPASLTRSLFKVGDRIRVDLDVDILKQMQDGHGGWNPRMAEFVGQVGCVHRITERGDVRVQYDGCNNRWTFHSGALTKVDSKKLCVGDSVLIADNMQKVRDLQKGHGEWTDSMRTVLGQTGKVVRVYSDGDVRVTIGASSTWTFNPAVCQRCVTSRVSPPSSSSPHIWQRATHRANTSSTRSSLDATDADTSNLQGGDAGDASTGDVSTGDVSTGDVSTGDVSLRTVTVGDQSAGDFSNEAFRAGDVTAAVTVSVGDVTAAVESVGSLDSTGEVSNLLTSLDVSAGHENDVSSAYNLNGGADTTDTDAVFDEDGRVSSTATEDSSNAVEPPGDDLVHTEGQMNVKAVNEEAVPPLHTACHFGDMKKVHSLLKLHDVNLTDKDGDSPLHFSVYGDQADVVEVLLERGANVNALNSAHCTSLMVAVHKEYTRCVQTLLSHAADPNIQDLSGDTPLHEAITKKKRPIIVRLCAERDIDFTVCNKKGFNTLHHAALQGELVAVQRILHRVPHLVDVRKDDGFVSLHLAALNGHTDVITALLTVNVEIDVRNEAGQTALHLATEWGYADIIETLASKGANLDIQDNQHNTCMHLLLKRAGKMQQLGGAPAITALMREIGDTSPDSAVVATLCHLVGLGASLELKDDDGQTLLQRLVDTDTEHIILRYARTPGMSSGECMVCSDNIVNVTFEPCGHRAVCSDCCVRMKRCLTCHEPIERKITTGGASVHEAAVSRGQLEEMERRMRDMEDSVVCSICLVTPRNVAFLCGHSACAACARNLQLCHMCRQPIKQKINLFT